MIPLPPPKVLLYCRCKLQAAVSGILPSATAISGYTVGLSQSVGAQVAVRLWQTSQMAPGLSLVVARGHYASTDSIKLLESWQNYLYLMFWDGSQNIC